MGVRILCNEENDRACLYCSTTMWAFGNIMYSREEAEAFLEYLSKDARRYTDKELESEYYNFRRDVWDKDM